MSAIWTTFLLFLHANAGHLLSIGAALVLTSLAVYPILSFVVSGWRIKREDIFSSFSEAAKIRYLRTFLKLDLADGAAATRFEEIYDARYGRSKYAGPLILFVIVCLAAMFLFSETGVTQISLMTAAGRKAFGGLPPGWFAYMVIDGVPAAGIAGAYLWLVSDTISKAHRLILLPSDVLNSALRLAMAAALSFAVTGMVKPEVGLPVAFALGAFPLDTVRVMFRRFAAKNLALGTGMDDQDQVQLMKLDSVDHTTADRLFDADITTITQLAYYDPVQLTMKTGFLFNYIVDIVSQALAWNYLGEKLDLIRPAGLRGAMEIYDTFTELHDSDSDIAQHASVVMDEAAETMQMSAPSFYNACDEIAGDPYTEFLCGIWRD